MKYSSKSELLVLIIAFLPLIYLLAIWNSLPATVPIHWNYRGEIDGTGRKENLLWIPFLLPILTYAIFLVVPIIDPKKKLQQMGDKLMKLKFAVTFVMSAIAVFIIHSVKQQALSPNFITILMGVLFTVLGNFFPVIKPNFFIGIRVPWTLASDDNWRQTHRFAGKLWFIGGISIIAYGLFSRPETASLFLLAITLLIVIIPVVYSFRLYQKEKRTAQK